MYERAATVAVFNNDISTAINILSEGSTVDDQSEKGIYILENVFHQQVNAHRVVVFAPNKYQMYRQKTSLVAKAHDPLWRQWHLAMELEIIKIDLESAL